MKDLVNDIMSENFTKREFIIYGIVMPLALMVICAIAGSL